MATENKVLDKSYVAAEDLSNDQYRYVVLTSTGTVRRPDSSTEHAEGILQNAPAYGEAAVVRLIGESKLQVNAAYAIGTFLKPEYVSAADAGKGTTGDKYARAKVVEASGAEDDLVTVRLIDEAPLINALDTAITDPGNAGAIPVTSSGVCPMTSAGAETRTIAAPTFIGQQIALIDDVHVGNIVVTAATAVNQTGNNTLTFGAAADACLLIAMQVAGALVWRIAANDGVALSTV